MDKKILINRIKLKVKQSNISVKKMLEDCEISKSFIYDIEKRGIIPSIEKIELIADYLDVSTDYLLGRTPNNNIKFSNENDIDFNNEYDKELATIIKNLKFLDDIDKGKISERIKIMLEDDKYNPKKELLNA